MYTQVVRDDPTQAPPSVLLPANHPSFRCELCKITVKSQEALNVHNTSNRHLRRQMKNESKNTTPSRAKNPKKRPPGKPGSGKKSAKALVRHAKKLMDKANQQPTDQLAGFKQLVTVRFEHNPEVRRSFTLPLSLSLALLDVHQIISSFSSFRFFFFCFTLVFV